MRSDTCYKRDAAGTSPDLYSMHLGMTQEELDRPLIGVVSLLQ